MDPLSIAASVTALATATFQIVAFLNNIKEGHRDRLRLLTEVNSLWMVLKLLEGQDSDELWFQGVRTLAQPNGVFPSILDQISEALQRLETKLKSQTGHRKALQTLRWNFDKSDIDSTIQHLGRLKQSVNIVLNHASLVLSQEIKADGAVVKDAIARDKMKAIIDWLSQLNFLVKQESIIKERREGTGRWLLESEIFKRWESGEESVLWTPGIPGAGKTFLASIVIEKLRELHQGQDVAIFMIYCSYNDPGTQSVESLIANLLKQDVQMRSVVDERLVELHQSHYKKETRPTLSELNGLLGAAISKYHKTYIVVDALDELLREPTRLELIDCLRTLQGKSNLMITTRSLPSIKQLFGPPAGVMYCDGCQKRPLLMYHHCTDCDDFNLCQECVDKERTCNNRGHMLVKRFASLKIKIDAADEDVRSYVDYRILGEPSLRQCVTKKVGLREEILEKVTKSAQGMFLLARFHMDSLATKLRPTSILEALNSLPTEIDSTYDQAMQRIETMNPDHRQIAKDFLAWVAYTDRPLSSREVEHATATSPGTNGINEDDIISADVLTSICAGLVTVKAGIITLVHYTARNYFNATRDKWFPDAHTKLGQICLTYLLFDAFEDGPCSGDFEDLDFEQRNREFPFLCYASSYWGRYAKDSQHEELRKSVLEFLNSKPHLDASVQALWYIDGEDALSWDAKTDATPLHIASFFGLELIVSKLLANGLDPDAEDSLGTTPLMYAALKGHDGVIRRLLQAGASVNAVCYRGSNSLHRAARLGHVKVSQALLSRKEIELNALDASQSHRSALMLATYNGHDSIVAELLKRSDLLVNLRSPWTALMLAGRNDETKILKLLLGDPRTNVNDQHDLGETALMIAARCGRPSVVETLLDNGADPEIKDGTEEGGGTPLLRAIDFNRLSVVRLLLQRKVDWLSKDRYNRTVVHGAAVNGRFTILRLLLEEAKGLDVNAQGSNGRTGLHDATDYGYIETIKVLLEFGAHTDIKDQWDLSPLKIAKQNNNSEAYELLKIARNSDIGRLRRVETDLSNPEVPLWVAASLGQRDLIQVATDAARTDPSVDLDQVNPATQRTPLHHAADTGQADIVNMLLEAGAKVDHQDNYGRTPMYLAAMGGHVATASAILDHHPDLTLRDQWGECALDAAENCRHWKVAILLVQNGAVPNEKNGCLHLVLCAAAAYGNSKVVLKLIKVGAQPQRKDEFGMTPFQLAKQGGHEETAQILLEHTVPKRSRAPSPVRNPMPDAVSQTNKTTIPPRSAG